MAKVKIEEIIDHLDSNFRRALDATVKEHFPNQDFNSRALFRTFRRMVYRANNTWEDVPNQYVEKD